MKSARLHLELLETAERLFNALANECRTRSFKTSTSNCGGWEDRLLAARREVDRRASRYLVALRNYRIAMILEFAPEKLAEAGIAGRVYKHRKRTAAATGAAGEREDLCARTCSRTARKEVPVDAYSRPTRVSQLK